MSAHSELHTVWNSGDHTSREKGRERERERGYGDETTVIVSVIPKYGNIVWSLHYDCIVHTIFGSLPYAQLVPDQVLLNEIVYHPSLSTTLAHWHRTAWETKTPKQIICELKTLCSMHNAHTHTHPSTCCIESFGFVVHPSAAHF